jgi:nitrous oxidase accessory protein
MKALRAGALVVGLAACARLAGPAPAHVVIAGPHERVAPATAITAQTTDELRALVADARGPAQIWLAPGTYGSIDVKRPVAIVGTRDVVLDGAHSGTVITIESNDVTIENVAVRASGRRHTAEDAGIKAKGDRIRVIDVRVEDTLFGVAFEMCHFCTIERVHVRGPGDLTELRGDGIKLWESNDTVVRSSLIEDSRDVVVWYTRRALLEDVVVRGGRYGTHLMYAHDSTVRRSRYERDVVGVFIMYSTHITLEDDIMAGARGAAGVGVGFKDSDGIEVHGTSVIANTTGAYIDNTPRTADAPLVFEDSLLALNDVALDLHTNGAGIRFHGNDFRDNAELVRVDGGGDALAAEFERNHFSDYQGYDLDGNGEGDVPYEVKQLSRELTDAKPQLRLFQGTLALGTIDAVARAVPVLAAKKLLVDPRPRMEAKP